MNTAPQYRYRAAYSQRAPFEPSADDGLLDHLTVHAPDAVTAARLIAASTGAAVVHEPERLGEVPADSLAAQVRYLARRQCPACKAWACTAVCTACGAFKFPKMVQPFADELAATERQAA